MELENKKKAEKMADMSKAERFSVNKDRRYLLLNFLANGEYWTTAENAKILLKVNHLSYVRRFLDTLINAEFLTKRAISLGGTPRNFYSITEKGLAFVDVFEPKSAAPKLSHQTMIHNELCQRLRLIALSSIGENLDWQTDIQLQRSNIKYHSYPDALLKLNKIYSIELQRNIYSYDGLTKKIKKCLADVYSGNFEQILFVCCENLNAQRLKNMFDKVDKVKNSKNEDIVISSDDKNKFIFIDFLDFKAWLRR